MEPATGIVEENSAYARAAKQHAIAATMNEIMSAGPACTAPVPVSTKIPVPMMAPIPRNVRSRAPSIFLSDVLCAPASMCSIFFLRNNDIAMSLLLARAGARLRENPTFYRRLEDCPVIGHATQCCGDLLQIYLV